MSLLNVKTPQLVYDSIQEEFEVTVGPLRKVDSINAITLNSRVVSTAPTTHTFDVGMSWSKDGLEYSHQQPLQATIDGIGNVDSLWLKIKVRITGFPAENFTTVVDSIDIDYGSPLTSQEDVLTGCQKCAKEVVFGQGSYDPYDIGPAVCFYQELNMMVNETFGLPTDYYKLDPETGSGDVILREYTLYNTRDMNRLKVVVPQNAFPENKLTYASLGSEYEQGFEVHMDKGYYEKYMGKDSHPRKNDIVHFHINDRLYEIDSIFLFRDFMQQGLFYKMILKKYQPKSNTKKPKGEASRQSIEDSIISGEELFGDAIRGEIKDIVNAVHEPVTQNRDLVRSSVDHNAVVPIEVRFNHTKIAEGFYSFGKSIEPVIYVNRASVGIEESCTVAFWYKTGVDMSGTLMAIDAAPLVTLSVLDGIASIGSGALEVQYEHVHGVWHCFVMDISNVYKQKSIEIFKADETTRLLESMVTETMQITPILLNGQIKIIPNKAQMTAIRFTEQLVQENDRRLFLLQFRVAQARKAIVVDNCLPMLDTSSISRPK